jgi:hypothetical protein
MGAGTPLTRITLSAGSVADDLGYVALADLGQALGDLTEDYRVIGGHMVTVLAARWQLGHELYRETGDVDLGIPPIVARDRNLGETVRCELPFADEVSALVLKAQATRVRSKDTDIADIWRCLEIAFAAGVGPENFAGGVRAESAELIRSLFRNRRNAPITAVSLGQRLSAEAADGRLTRIRALISRVLGSG